MLKRSFRPGFKELDGWERKEVRAKIMERCFWHRKNASFKGLNIFYRKMRGETRINELEIREIEAVFEEYGVNPWTGERFKNFK